MFASIFAKSTPTEDATRSSGPAGETLNILVIDARQTNWAAAFPPSLRTETGGERKIAVDQCGWGQLNLAAYPSGSRCCCDIRPSPQPIPGTKQDRQRSFQPSILLIRNEVRGVPDQANSHDHRNLLFGLKFAQVASVNSLDSIFAFLERPWVHASLLEIEKRVGSEDFPVIPQNYYPNHREMLIGPQFPAVVKVGHAHAGYGKMIINDHRQFADFASVMAVTNGLYCTAEEYLEGDHDVRVQRIGPKASELANGDSNSDLVSYRAFKRISVSGNWKTNTGTSMIENIELTDTFKRWADLASEMFGGLEICTVDAIYSIKQEKYFILEVNGTSSGLLPEHTEADNKHICGLVIRRLAALASEDHGL